MIWYFYRSDFNEHQFIAEIIKKKLMMLKLNGAQKIGI